MDAGYEWVIDEIRKESIFGEDATKYMSESSVFMLDNFKYYDIDFNLGARISHHSKYKLM